ncbi:hypothetical protein CXB51_024348 [Gossypium anomalum]|uniref:Reverse transcriptase Ty1/copia-type domain-containing protein n=1 Tax=Gossypium anomalum TaxID=47600 RepID=A0A8J6CPN0_9ROSI|nr:hypothetical protein CXB51_024348 [Gossypium anomalum]
MAITRSPDSNFVEPSGSVFTSDRIVTSFPRHDVVKVDEASDGTLAANPTASIFIQQDNLLTSWLLSTISLSFLSSFTDHELHSLKKGSLSIRAYVDKIKGLCAFLAASGSQISEAKKMVISLAGLSSEFDAIVSSAPLSSGPLPFQCLVYALIEYEARQMQSVSDVLVAMNFVEESPSPAVNGSSRGGRPPVHGRWSTFGTNEETWPGQNWMINGQNWIGPPKEVAVHQYIQPNVEAIPTRGLYAANILAGPNPFVLHGSRSTDHGLNVAIMLAIMLGALWPLGPSGSVRPRLSDGLNFSGPNANCVYFSEVPWQTKSRVLVFDVESSQYDSSQFVGIPRLSEFHASDFSDATTYDSNFNSTDSYVSLPVGSTSWCPDSGATIMCVRMLLIYVPHLLIQDIQTQVILMRGQVRDGLYHFSVDSADSYLSAHNTNIQEWSPGDDIFTLWHERLGHPFSAIVKTILANCQIVTNKRSLDNLCLICGDRLLLPVKGICIMSRSLTCVVDLPGVVHLINRLPTPVLKDMALYQSLFGSASTYDHLWVFGAVVFHTYVHPRQISNPASLPANTCESTHIDSSATCSRLQPTSVDSMTNLGTSIRETLPSTTDPTTASTIAIVPTASTTNTHAMVTRSKVGIFKPKALSVNTIDFEPTSVEADLAHPDWQLTVIGCKWLFKARKNPDGTIERRKAQLVTKGCSQVDVNNAFLNEDLTDKVFMQQPPCYVQLGPNGEQLVCRLTKALYGLRQALRACLAEEIDCFVQQLHNKFILKDIGNLHYFLGIEVSWSTSGRLHLCQQKYIRELFDRSSMTDAKSVHTPMVSLSILSKDEGERLADPIEYRSLAGALQYVVLTRPDIAYAVNRVCQFMHAPTKVHMVALKRILRYLRGTLSHGLVFRRSGRLSLKLQVISRSTAEAEYRSLAVATSDIAWLVSLLTELKICSVNPSTVWCDNSSAIVVTANPVLHFNFKHVELDLFFVHEKVANRDLVVGEVPACDQVADILTKPLYVSFFTRFHHLLHVVPLEEAG